MMRAILAILPFASAIDVAPHLPLTQNGAHVQPNHLSGLVEPASECWLKVGRHNGRHKGRHTVLEQNPGAGLDEFQPFDRVWKDGMMKMNCIKDSMFLYGDKFGGNKHEYKLGPTANVSIVHYEDHVAKEDREQMTPRICFQFCRTVPEMGYFGITNGRDCYCEPYFKALASDDSTCDSVCEGDLTQMCGSKTKSTIWEMHACNDGAQVLATATIKAYTLQLQLDELITDAMSAASGKQNLATDFQQKFGQAGDPAAAGLMQMAKVSAGKLLHLAEQAETLRDDLRNTILGAAAMTGLNLNQFRDADDADGDLEDLPLFQAVVEWINQRLAAQFMRHDVAMRGDKFVRELEEKTPVANETLQALQELYLLSEPEISPEFIVRRGSCIVDDQGCVKNHPTSWGHYYNYDYCTIEIQGGEIELRVEKFDTHYYDYLYMNGIRFAGNDHHIKQQKTASGWMYWRSNWYYARSGWKICGVQKQKEERGIQYYPAMYFIDKEYVAAPMSCTGTVIEQPIYYKSYHGCALACDARVGDCVGFSYFPTSQNQPNLCFLFSSFKTGQYYTGCDSLLQKNNATRLAIDQPIENEPSHPVCVAKLSRFVGTTLKPNPEGKCKECFKEVTKANRCWQTGAGASAGAGPPRKSPPK